MVLFEKESRNKDAIIAQLTTEAASLREAKRTMHSRAEVDAAEIAHFQLVNGQNDAHTVQLISDAKSRTVTQLQFDTHVRKVEAELKSEVEPRNEAVSTVDPRLTALFSEAKDMTMKPMEEALRQEDPTVPKSRIQREAPELFEEQVLPKLKKDFANWSVSFVMKSESTWLASGS